MEEVVLQISAAQIPVVISADADEIQVCLAVDDTQPQYEELVERPAVEQPVG